LIKRGGQTIASSGKRGNAFPFLGEKGVFLIFATVQSVYYRSFSLLKGKCAEPRGKKDASYARENSLV